MSDQTPPAGDPSPDYSAAPPPPPPPPMAAPAAPGAEVPLNQSEERMWAMLAHIGGILIGFLSGLLVMLIMGKRSAFANDQAKEALNFQITLLIGWIVAFVTSFLFIGFLLYPVLAIANLVFCILGGLAANKGELYRYPLTLRLVK